MKTRRTLALLAAVGMAMAAGGTVQAAFVAYHDLGATTGQESTGNITTHQSGGSGSSANPLDTTPKSLIKYSDGAATGVSLSIAGANAMDSRSGVTGPPNAGTPADPLFNVAGLNLNNGLIYEGGTTGSGSTNFSLTGLNPGQLYDVALYGHRSASADGVERFTLSGAAAAVNSSSTGVSGTFVTDMQTRPNQTTGDVVRWTGINPGTDGAITINVDPEVTSPNNIAYLSALRLAETGPRPAGFVAYHDLGGDPSPGNITTQPDLATSVQLITFADGANTGIGFSVAGANGVIATGPGVTLPPAGGTPAGNLFLASGIDLDDGLIVEGGNTGSGATTFTLSGLDPTRLYDLAIYGDRNTTADGVERFTLGGADAAVNASSAYKISSTATDLETRPNSAAGHVARWSDIRPGADGTITVDIDPEVTSPSNVAYLSSLRLEDTGAAPLLVRPSAIAAYHDLGGEPSPGNITTQQSLGTTHTLIDFATGADTGIQFSIAGANGIDTRTGTVARPPNAGTPAGDLFLASGIDLNDGLVFEGGNNGSGATTFTFAGLLAGWEYDIALYGDRNASQDGVERFTLIGADGATNSSSTGIISDFITDMQTRPNSAAGNVVRWTDIKPGADGIIMIDIDPEVTSPSNIAYLSGIRLTGREVPEPATMALLGLAACGLGGYVRRRKTT